MSFTTISELISLVMVWLFLITQLAILIPILYSLLIKSISYTYDDSEAITFLLLIKLLVKLNLVSNLHIDFISTNLNLIVSSVIYIILIFLQILILSIILIKLMINSLISEMHRVYCSQKSLNFLKIFQKINFRLYLLGETIDVSYWKEQRGFPLLGKLPSF